MSELSTSIPYKSDSLVGELSLADVFSLLWRKKSIITLTTLFFIFSSIIYSFVVTPVYRATIQVVPVMSNTSGNSSIVGQLGGIASLAGLKTGSAVSESKINMATFLSRNFTLKYIKEHDLLPILFEEEWSEFQRNPEKDNFFKNETKIFSSFNGMRLIEEDNKTGLIALHINWKEPEQTAKIANSLIASINDYLRKQAINE
jgi:uncharacterized protein involved in exopolysaccharide biosynthesis